MTGLYEKIDSFMPLFSPEKKICKLPNITWNYVRLQLRTTWYFFLWNSGVDELSCVHCYLVNTVLFFEKDNDGKKLKNVTNIRILDIAFLCFSFLLNFGPVSTIFSFYLYKRYYKKLSGSYLSWKGLSFLSFLQRCRGSNWGPRGGTWPPRFAKNVLISS